MLRKKDFPNLICIIGMDGSGKTTVARELVHQLNSKGGKYKYAWVNNQPIFMYLLRFFWRAKLKIKRINSYNEYKKEKKSLAQKSVIRKIYDFVHFIDYVLWVWIKVKVPLLFGRKLIVDRYYFDVAINYVLIEEYVPKRLIDKIKEYSMWMPQPEIIFFLDITEETAFSRKDDIPSIEYLRERKHIYKMLANKFNMITINGEEKVSKVIEEIIIQINNKVKF